MSDNELKTPVSEEADLVSEFRSLLEEREASTLRGFRELIAGMREPQREKLPARHAPQVTEEPDGGDAVHADRIGRVGHRGDYRYRRLSPIEREIRNPKVDLQLTRWISAMQEGRPDLAERACREANALMRATWDEGTIDPLTGRGDGTADALIPVPMANLIMLYRDVSAKMRSRVTVLQSANLSLRLPDLGRSVATIYAEGSGPTEDTPVADEVILSKRKLGVAMAATEEAEEDNAFNTVSLFTERAGTAIGAGEDVEITRQTAGNFTTAYGSGANVAGDLLTVDPSYANMVTLYYAITSPYRMDGIWTFSDVIAALVSSILDGNGRPIFTPAGDRPTVVGDNQPAEEGRIFGRPVVTVPQPDNQIMFGAPSYYGLLDGGSIRARSFNDQATETTTWRFRERVDGGNNVGEAFAILVNAGS